MRTLRVFLSWPFCIILSALFALAVPSFGQSVISTHAGVIYYFDGAVYLGDQPLQSHLGTFATIPAGAELRTAQGHAEVLLTPGVFLRMGENSAVRLIANGLKNARIEMESGSAIVESDPSSSASAPTLLFKDWEVRGAAGSSYRLDSDPPRVWALQDDVDVTTAAGGQSIRVEEGMDLPYSATPKLEPSLNQPDDSLTAWAKGRSDSIAADNNITQQIDSDPDAQAINPGDFSYFPPLGVPPISAYSAYSSTVPPQPGFYSMYLPGYTYAPLLILPMIGRMRGAIAPGVLVPGVGVPGVFVPGMVTPGMVLPGVAGIRNGLRGGVGPGIGIGGVGRPGYAGAVGPGAGRPSYPGAVALPRPVYPGGGIARPGQPMRPGAAVAPRPVGPAARPMAVPAAPGIHR